jgi:hypothetical protein
MNTELEILTAQAEYAATILKEVEAAYEAGEASLADWRVAYQDDKEARRAHRKCEIGR